MKTWYEQVQEFSKKANKAQNELDPSKWVLIPESATPLNQAAIEFISQMILDEIEELEEAETEYEQADAFLDIIYYTLDTAAKHSIVIDFPIDRRHPTVTPILLEDGKLEAITTALRNLVSNIEGDGSVLQQICLFCHRFADATGYDLNPLFDLVQSANMAKFPEGIVTLNTDPESKRYGKVEKPEGWQSPDSKIKEALEAQKLTIDYKGQDIDGWLKEQREKAAKERGDAI